MLSNIFSAFTNSSDYEKFLRIYHRYYRLMYAAANQILHNKYDSEDAVEEALIKIINHIDIINDSAEDKLKGLCVVISKNTALDLIRRRSHESVTEGENVIADFVDNHESFEVSLADKLLIKEALKKLSDREQSIIYLKYNLDLSTAEIAGLLSLSEANVRVILVRAREKIRKEIGD